MAKSIEGITQPIGARQITLEFIEDYFKKALEQKAITKKKYSEWIKTVEQIENDSELTTTAKKTAAVKKAFIKEYYPQFSRETKSKLLDKFKALQ